MDSERKQKYLQELDEAIKELNAAYAEYDNIEFLININKMNDQEKEYFKKLINTIRLYETHAYIRLKTLEEKFDEKYKTLIETRIKTKKQIPDKKDVEQLVIEYNKIKAKELEGEKFLKSL